MSYYDDQEAYWAEKEAKKAAKKEKRKAKLSTVKPTEKQQTSERTHYDNLEKRYFGFANRRATQMSDNSYFELNVKNVIIYLCYIFICAVIGICTLGIALPWPMCSFYRWRAAHTFIDGKPLEFTGSGTALFVESLYFPFLIMTILSCGLAFPLLFASVHDYLGYRYNHVIVPDSKQELRIRNYFSFDAAGYFIFGLVVAIISLGAALPWVLHVYYKRDTRHTLYRLGLFGTFGLEFTAKSGADLFFKGGYGLCWLLGMICTYFYSSTQSTILFVLAVFLLPSLAMISTHCWRIKNTHVVERLFNE